MFEEGPGRLVFFEAAESERFITAFDDEKAWKRHRARISNLGPVKVGLRGFAGAAEVCVPTPRQRVARDSGDPIRTIQELHATKHRRKSRETLAHNAIASGRPLACASLRAGARGS